MARSFSYPIPVAGSGDDVAGGGGEYEIANHVHNDALIIDIERLAVPDPALQAMLMSQSAAWVAQVHCATTYFRKLWTTFSPAIHVEIPLSQLSQKVEVEVRLISKATIPGYRPAGIHADFGSAAFSVAPGDILATAPSSRLFIDSAYDPLKGEVASIMRIAEGPYATGPVDVDFDAAQIVIRVPKLDWDNYKLLKNNAPQILHSAVVLPVLMQAIYFVRSGEPAYEGLPWFERIEVWLEAHGLGDDSRLIDAAQKLLDNPVSRSFQDARYFAGEDDE